MDDELVIKIPDSFQILNSEPDDPDNSIAYGKQTPSAMCFIIMFPIKKENAMSFDNEKEIIDGIHGVLRENQGLVEVKTGLTNNQRKYVYSIVKTKLEPTGMQYILTTQIDMNDLCMNIQAYFDEAGMTGLRDTTIMNQMINERKINPPDMDGWFKDPYVENYKKGLLMNMSEKEEYDSMFPQHPLSEIRNLVKYIIENN